MSKAVFKTLAHSLKRKLAARPSPNSFTFDEVVESMGESEEKTREYLNLLIKEGSVRPVKGKTLNASEQLINCTYYEPVEEKKKA